MGKAIGGRCVPPQKSAADVPMRELLSTHQLRDVHQLSPAGRRCASLLDNEIEGDAEVRGTFARDSVQALCSHVVSHACALDGVAVLLSHVLQRETRMPEPTAAPVSVLSRPSGRPLSSSSS